jgi:hypothetical protein
MSNYVRLLEAHAMPLQVSTVRRWDVEDSHIDMGALVPDSTSLRPINATLLDEIAAIDSTEPSALIEVFPAPEDLLATAREHDRNEGDLAAAALGRLAALGASYDAEYILERRSPAHKLVATVWPNTDQSPGIHVDRRDALPLASRLQSRRRLGINIGPGSRWLLACFPDIVTIAEELGRGPETAPETTDLEEYIDKHPDEVSCVWIPLPPGWAYKMPSDSIGHDGSTFRNSASHMYYFLGHWGRGELTKTRQPA